MTQNSSSTLDLKVDLYEILHISKEVILDDTNNVDFIFRQYRAATNVEDKLVYMNAVIEIAGKFHSYLHFEHSIGYLLLAYAYYLERDRENAMNYKEKALFQDPFNNGAINFLSTDSANRMDGLDGILLYDKNYRFELDFLRFAIGRFRVSSKIEELDRVIRDALSDDPNIRDHCFFHESHRLPMAYGIAALRSGLIGQALVQFRKSCEILESSHKSYHRYAADIYELRAGLFEALGMEDLMKADLIKSGNF